MIVNYCNCYRFQYILVQSETGLLGKGAIIVNGNGTDLVNEKAIKGRAKRKMITNKMTLSLVDVAKENKTLTG
jgi:hypothetical protein